MMTDPKLAPSDLELLAAFIDQRLSGAERRAFLERLEVDERLYEVFVETVRTRDEEHRASLDSRRLEPPPPKFLSPLVLLLLVVAVLLLIALFA